MIICKRCGLRNADDLAFCANCGAFLEWEGERVAPPPPPPEPPPPEPPPPPPPPPVVVAPEPEPAPPAPANPARASLAQRFRAAMARDEAKLGGSQRPSGAPPDKALVPAAASIDSSPSAEAGLSAPPEVSLAPAPTAPAGPTAEPSTQSPETDGRQSDVSTPAALEDPGPSSPATPNPASPPSVESSPPGEPPAEEAAAAGPSAPAATAVASHPGSTGGSPDELGDPAASEPAGAGGTDGVEDRLVAPERVVAPVAAAEGSAGSTGPPEVDAASRRAATMVARRPTRPPPPPPRAAPAPAAVPEPEGDGEGAEAAAAAAAATAVHPEAVKPGMPRNRVVVQQQQSKTRELQPGDLICGHCGQGNEPTRRFCLRCGSSLVEAKVLVIPWWRRLVEWRPGHKQAKPPAPVAGVDPDSDGPEGRPKALKVKRQRNLAKVAKSLLIPLLALLVVVALIVPGIRRSIGSNVTRGKNALSRSISKKTTPVHALSAVAPSDPTHPAALLIDGNASSYWATPSAANSGLNTAIQIDLGETTPLDFLIFTIGAQVPDNFASLARPEQVLVVYSDGQNPQLVQRITLQDTAAPQKVRVQATSAKSAKPTSVKSVKTVTIQITQIYPGSSQSQFSVAIAEIEFRRFQH